MATSLEIKEDFTYALIVEIALLIAISANSIYAGDFKTPFIYLLIFAGVVMVQKRVECAILLSKERSLKVKLGKILEEKKRAKKITVALLIALIILSSWGIVSYVARIYLDTREYAKILTMAIPWYVVIYSAWIAYLLYLKGKYTRLLVSLLSKKQAGGRIRHILLLHHQKIIARLSTEPMGEREIENLIRQISEHSEGFRYGNEYVEIVEQKPLKLGVVLDGPSSSELRIRMNDALKAIRIEFPKKFEDGNYKEGELAEVEGILRRYLLQQKKF